VTVLVAVADDDLWNRVLAVGLRLAEAFDEPVSVVHLTADASAGADARGLRDRINDALADADVSYDVSIEHAGRSGARSGRSIGRQVADIAADVDVSHVVIGHASGRSLREALQGSAAFGLADDAAVPVTVVPGGMSEPSSPTDV
jgi:nucleotide-binding universal stress UspA family protein